MSLEQTNLLFQKCKREVGCVSYSALKVKDKTVSTYRISTEEK